MTPDVSCSVPLELRCIVANHFPTGFARNPDVTANADSRVAVQEPCRHKPLGPFVIHVRQWRPAFATERCRSVRSLELLDQLGAGYPYDILGASPVNGVRASARCLATHGAMTLTDRADPTPQLEHTPAAKATSFHALFLIGWSTTDMICLATVAGRLQRVVRHYAHRCTRRSDTGSRPDPRRRTLFVHVAPYPADTRIPRRRKTTELKLC